MNTNKICPLFFASSADLEEFECRPDRCAWWNQSAGACAVAAVPEVLDKAVDSLKNLAASLSDIADKAVGL